MNETVKKLEVTVDEVKTKLTSLMIENGSIEHITAEDLQSMQMIFKLLNGIVDVVREQSEIIEKLNLKVESKMI